MGPCSHHDAAQLCPSSCDQCRVEMWGRPARSLKAEHSHAPSPPPPLPPPLPLPPCFPMSSDFRCAPSYNDQTCRGSQCCSSASWCGGTYGSSSAHCIGTEFVGAHSGTYSNTNNACVSSPPPPPSSPPLVITQVNPAHYPGNVFYAFTTYCYKVTLDDEVVLQYQGITEAECNPDNFTSIGTEVGLGVHTSAVGLTACNSGGSSGSSCDSSGSTFGTCAHSMDGNRASELIVYADSSVSGSSTTVSEPTPCYSIITLTVPIDALWVPSLVSDCSSANVWCPGNGGYSWVNGASYFSVSGRQHMTATSTYGPYAAVMPGVITLTFRFIRAALTGRRGLLIGIGAPPPFVTISADYKSYTSCSNTIPGFSQQL